MRSIALPALLTTIAAFAQPQAPAWSAEEQPILAQLRTLRALPDDKRGEVTRRLAQTIRKLVSPGQLRLATNLTGLSTEGDFGKSTLQEVGATLAAALERTPPPPDKPGVPAMPYIYLAQLIRYEHVQIAFDSPQLKAAFAKLDSDDQRRRDANFTLKDLTGKSWTLRDLKGSIVLVNFWATWCPPCRKEMPDLDSLYHRFSKKGLVILSLSDEAEATVKAFLADKHYTYPILLDPDKKVHEAFGIEGLPRSFVYDRNGKLIAQAVDMRTMNQFVQMLREAGLQ